MCTTAAGDVVAPAILPLPLTLYMLMCPWVLLPPLLLLLNLWLAHLRSTHSSPPPPVFKSHFLQLSLPQRNVTWRGKAPQASDLVIVPVISQFSIVFFSARSPHVSSLHSTSSPVNNQSAAALFIAPPACPLSTAVQAQVFELFGLKTNSLDLLKSIHSEQQTFWTSEHSEAVFTCAPSTVENSLT